MAVADTVVVVPCFDEANRLRLTELDEISTAGVALTLVDDGSTDGTGDLLAGYASGRPGVSVLTLPFNAGKAAAVRSGLVHARSGGARWIGYCDADFSTPPGEMLRLIDLARARPELAIVIGSRLSLLGRTIERSGLRHAGGRVFAAAAAQVLGLPVHDSQCGAKVLHGDPLLDAALARPFRSRWAFDVELLGRLSALGVPAAAMWEEPLREWREVTGSKRSVSAAVRATLELAPIARDLRGWRPR